jgi:hypothetical protein
MREFNLLNYKDLNKGAVIKLHFYAVAFSRIRRTQTTITPKDGGGIDLRGDPSARHAPTSYF